MRFTESHEWIATDGTVGITEYAKNELGDIVFIELPKIGAEVKAGRQVCVLESTKAAVDVYSPVSGVVTAVNEDLLKSPTLLKEENGWLFRIRPSNLAEMEKLMSLSEYEKLIT